MRLPILAATVPLLLLAGCSSTEDATSTQPSQATQAQVAVSHYPVQYLVERVGGDLVAIEELTSPGTEPHDLELSPQQVGTVQNAKALFYIAGFQPAIDEAAAQAQGDAVDLTQGLTLRQQDGVEDPHVWLDPELMGQMAGTIAETLASVDPDNAAQYRDNASAVQAQMGSLDADWSAGTATCDSRTMVVSHEAFGYLTDRYDFTQKGISGLSPESEPSASAIAELARFVTDNGVSTVYTETAIDPAVAETIAQEAGARTSTLDPLETAPATGDYDSAMRENLAVVVAGQSCS